MSQNELQRLLPRHFKIIDLCLAGHSTKDIALAVDMTPQAISLITKSPNFQHELARRRNDVEAQTNANLATIPSRAKDLLENASYDAAQTVIGLLQSPDPKTQLGASKDILDRVFGDSKAPQTKVLVLDAAAMAGLQQALREANDFSEPIDVVAK